MLFRGSQDCNKRNGLQAPVHLLAGRSKGPLQAALQERPHLGQTLRSDCCGSCDCGGVGSRRCRVGGKVLDALAGQVAGGLAALPVGGRCCPISKRV